jgi:hypothetical protein
MAAAKLPGAARGFATVLPRVLYAALPTAALLTAALLSACDPTIMLGTANVDAAAVDAVPAVDGPSSTGDRSEPDDSSLDAAASDASSDGDAGGPDAIEVVDGQASVVWRATFETGDFSEWSADGQGGTFSSMNSAHATSTEQAHSGASSAKLTITPASGLVEYLYMFRGGPGAPALPAEAYYGAWFFIPYPYIESQYWNLFHFLQSAMQSRAGLRPIWDLDLRSNAAGDLVPYVWDFIARRQRDEPVPLPVPVGQWFHLEVFLRVATTATGRFALWQDGVLVLDVENVVTSVAPWTEWDLGSTSLDIMPAPADLYVDDVTLSLSRAGP